ncbi:transmembrane 9 superfamily member 4-like [Limulus polyphemus]|uniref:Transmembrane 9 superfamily member n=1 Tax=Limulus polyphemus TaxID=6850 RepID=A0ABM1BW95_LIMPO|nr:transmembrane 9 superfamily member 4-like [Limulus polyphemus]
MQNRSIVSSCVLILTLNLIERVAGFYVPGVAPVEFSKGQVIEVKAVKMTSTHTQLPYEYYSLPFCRPKNNTIVYKSENLGEVLRGDRIVSTAYEVKMATAQSCKVLCHDPYKPMLWSEEESKLVASRIQHHYYVHLIVDNLPCATRFEMLDTNQPQYEHGYRLGFIEDGTPYINNHLKLILKYHTEDGINFRVVGFEVVTKSIAFSDLTFDGNSCTFPEKPKKQEINLQDNTEILFTYEVLWEASDIRWASRWDTYLAMSDAQIHWFSIINSVVVIFFLSGILTMIIIRTLRRDIARYNKDEDMEDTMEETGWKLVHGDVFRPPLHPKLFAAVVGTGIQLFFMTFITIFFAMLGMLSPASRGALMTVAIFLFVFMGLFAGYFSGRMYRTLRGNQWKKSAFLVSLY